MAGAGIFDAAPAALNTANAFIKRLDALIAANEQQITHTMKNVEEVTTMLESQNEEIPVTPLGDRDPDDAASYLTDDRDADDRSARSALSSRSLLDRDGATPRSQARSGLASGDGLASRLELDDLSPRTSAGGFGTPRSQSNLGTPRSALSGRSGRSASILPY